MKKVILSLSLLVILTAGVYLFIRLEIFATSLKYLAQSQLTAITGSPVKIEKVSWIPVNKIIFKKITFDGFFCEEATISLNLKKISKGIGAVEKITLTDPQVNLQDLRDLLQKKSPGISKLKKFPPVSIYVNNGTVLADAFDIRKIYIKAVSKENIYTVKTAIVFNRTRAEEEKNRFSGKLKLAGHVNKDLSELKLKGELRDIIFREIDPLNGNINITGNINTLKVSGNIASNEAVIKIKSTLNLQDANFTSRLSGNIYNLKTFIPKLVFVESAVADNKNYPELVSGSILSSLPEGPLSFDGFLELPDTKLKFNFEQQCTKSTGLINIKKIKTCLIYYKGEWIISSTATALGRRAGPPDQAPPDQDNRAGIIILDGKIRKDKLDLSLHGHNLFVIHPRGEVNFSFNTDISETFSKPKLTGKLKINKFIFADSSFKNAYGNFFWANGHGRLKLKGPAFSVNLSANETRILNCKIKYDTAKISLSGKFNKINFNAVNINSSLLDRRFSGLIDLSGYITDGFSENPGFYAGFSSPNITINKTSTPVSGTISYSGGIISIKKLALDGLSGDIKIKLGEALMGIGETSGRLKLSKCSSNLVLPFIGIGPDILTGTISGKINWSGKIQNPGAYGTIAITRGHILKTFPYDLIVTSFKTDAKRHPESAAADEGTHKLIITEFAVQQKASKTVLQLSGEIERNKFNLLLKLKELIVAKKHITGNLTFSGRKRGKNIHYKITSRDLAIDNISERFLAKGTYNSEKIELSEITWGNKIKGKSTYFVASKYLSSNIDFAVDAKQFLFSLSATADKKWGKNITGEILGEIIVRGNIKKPLVLLDCNYRGNIYNLPAQGTGKIFIKQNMVKIEDTRFSIDESEAEISGSLDLREKKFTGLNISVNNLKTDLIYTLFKSSLPLSGTLKSADLNITGSFGNPRISAGYSGTDMYIEDKKVDFIDGRFTLQNKRVVFSKGNIKWGETQIKILPETYIDFSKKIVFKIISEIRNLKMPGVVLFGGVIAEGRYTTHAGQARLTPPDDRRAGKTVGQATVKGDISTSGLWVNQLRIRNVKQHIEYSGGILKFIPETGKTTQITGTIDFSKPSEINIGNFAIFESGRRLFLVNGFMNYDVFEISSEGSNIRLGDLLNLLNLKVSADGSTDFNIKISGTRKNPRVTCILNSSNGKIEDVAFDIASLFFQINENILELKHLKISQKKIYSIQGEGRIPLPLTPEMRKKLSGEPIDISLNVKNGDMALLTALTKSVKKAKGKFSTSLDITGTLKKPEIAGEFNAYADVILMKNIFKKLKDVKCRIKFTGRKIELKELSALIGKEPLVINGYIMITEGFDFDKFEFYVLTPEKGVAVTVNELQIKSGGVGKIIPGIPDITAFSNPSKAKVSADINIFGTPESWNIDGYMKLSNAKFVYPGEEGEEGAWDFLENANWNLKLIAGKNCWYENDFISVEAKGELLLHDKGVAPLITGKVEAMRGELNYLGRDFRIIEAVFEAEKSNLFLSGRAEAETEIEIRREDPVTHLVITEYLPETIILTLDRGPLENVKPKFSSKTDSQIGEQLAAQAAMGLADTRQKQPFSAKEITKTVDTLLTTPFVKSLLKRTGFIDRFTIKREATTQERESTARTASDGSQPTGLDLYKGTKLKFGKSFSRGFSAGYGVKFDEIEDRLSLKHEIELAYRLKSGILFRTSRELERDGVSKFFLEKYWRFGTESKKKQNND